jgi:hypothetical protein
MMDFEQPNSASGYSRERQMFPNRPDFDEEDEDAVEFRNRPSNDFATDLKPIDWLGEMELLEPLHKRTIKDAVGEQDEESMKEYLEKMV